MSAANAQILKLILLGHIKASELKKADDAETAKDAPKVEGGSTAVDASVPVGPKGIKPKAPNEVGKGEEKKEAGIDKRTVGATAGALGAAAGAGFAAGRFTKKDKKKDMTKECQALVASAGPLSFERILGLVNGYMDASTPSPAVIEKLASASGRSAETILARIMQKRAAGLLLPLIGGALAGGVAAPMAWQGMKHLSRFVMDPTGEMRRPQNMAAIGGMSPMQQNRISRLTQQEAARNLQQSSNLQGLRGAYRPAPDPWGVTSQV